MTHHKTWFPVIVVALSLLLGLFIFSVYKERLATSREPVEPVTAAEYQARAHVSVSGLSAKLALAPTDTDRIALLTQTREELLALLVPAEFKDLHLEMVMALTQWISGYEGRPDNVSAATSRWQSIVDQYSWIE